MRHFTRILVLALLALTAQGFLTSVQAQTTYTLGSGGWTPATGPMSYDPVTKIATITGDLTAFLRIAVTGATLDGGGFKLTGSGTGNGILLAPSLTSNLSNVTVKNFALISNFQSGIRIATTSTGGSITSCKIIGNTISDCSKGIDIVMINSTKAIGTHTIESNLVKNNVTGVSIVGNASSFRSTGNTLTKNTLENNSGNGLYLNFVGGTSVYNNNFIQTPPQVQVLEDASNGSNLFSQPLTVGGNYWSTWTSPDANNDGTVDNPYPLTTPNDAFPWTTKNGWAGSTDVTPPVTTASPTPGENVWFNSNVTVELVPSDQGGSGVKSTFYSFDQSSWPPYDKLLGVPISTEGIHTLYFYSVDNAGNTEATKSITVRIDKTAPTITAGRAPLANSAGWNNTDVTASYSASDAGSGLASPGTADHVFNLDGASQSITFTVTDIAGNQASATVSNVNIDKTPPTFSTSQSPAANADGWNKTDVTVSYSAEDILSGLVSPATGSADITTEGSAQSHSFEVFDVAGNKSTITVSVNIDRTSPAVSVSLSPAPNTDGWNNSDVTATYTATDIGGSGVATPTGTSVFTTDGQGLTHTFTVADRAGNEGSATVNNVNLDKTFPVTTATPAGTPGVNGAYVSDVSVTLVGTDGGSGISSTEYSLDGTIWTTGLSTTINQTATVHFRSTDKAGNVETAKLLNIKIDRTITATAGSNGSISPSGPVIVSDAAPHAFTITPDVGHHVLDVLVDGISVGAVTTYSFSNVTADHSISASFAINTYTLSPSVGPNGTITPSGVQTVNYGTNHTFSITPDAGYHIADVLVDGVSVGAVTTYTFSSVDANHTISATFAVTTYTLNSSAGANGAITPLGSQTVNSGSDHTFAITPNAGYHVADVLVDGVSVGAVTTYTFNNVAANHTIAASFAINTYTLTATAGTGGTISPSGAVTVSHGESQTFAIAPSGGYHVANVLVDGVSVGAVTTYTFNNVAANHTIAASFAIDTYTLTATAGTGGTISPSGAVTVSHDGSQTFAIAPIAGYHVADVLVDGISVGAVSSYTFSNVTVGHAIAASFAIDTYTLTATAGTGGTIAPSGTQTVNSGADQTFAIAPSAGYQVADVVVDGVSAGAVTSYTFTNVTANHTISASFAINTYTIIASAGPNGSISPVGTLTVNHGANQAFTITPNAGDLIADVLVDGVSVGAVATYTFTNVTADHTIAASFAVDVTIAHVTGGGWINSPAGAYPKTPTLKGKAEFGFTAKYEKDRPDLKGELEFQLKGALKFKATNLESLTGSGAYARLTGSGTNDGKGNYGFSMSLIDGKIVGTKIDKWRIKIWDKNNGNALVYDSEIGASETAPPTLVLGGGSITIHESKDSKASSLSLADATEAAEIISIIPTDYALYNAYPNPFNPSATIKFDLPEAAKVRLAVYDMLGREVAVLADEERPAGQHSVRFDAGRLSSGMYIYRLQAGNFKQTKKLMLMK